MKLTGIEGVLNFKIRFNTTHGDTDLFWRVIVDEKEYLVTGISCNVPAFSDRSFDKNANAVKYHIAGSCTGISISPELTATFN